MCIFSPGHEWHVLSGASRCISWAPAMGVLLAWVSVSGRVPPTSGCSEGHLARLPLLKGLPVWPCVDIAPKEPISVHQTSCHHLSVRKDLSSTHLCHARFWTRNWAHGRENDLAFGLWAFSNFHSWWRSKFYLSVRRYVFLLAWFHMCLYRGKNENEQLWKNSWTFWALFTIHKVMIILKIHRFVNLNL